MSKSDLSNLFKDIKLMDWILIGLTILLVMRTCGGDKLFETPKQEVVVDGPPDNALVAPTDSPPLPGVTEDEEVVPEGLPSDGVERFTFGGECDPMCSSLPAEERVGNCDGCPEGFSQTVTPAPAGGKKCPKPMIYTAKHLTKGDADEGCWAGDGSLSTSCIPGGASKVANFYDASQTQTVIDAIDRDPTREMKIRQAPATANYDLRASPPIPFNGFPSLSFVGGNQNTGLKV